MTQLSKRDWETLSEYLDNQIGARDRKEFETRLQKDPLLVKGLEQLRNTRLILRSCPKFRAPRSFVLTQQMIGAGNIEKPVRSLYSTLRLTAVLATIFLVIITSGNLLFALKSPEPILVSEAQFSNAQLPPALGKGGGGGGAIPAPLVLPTQEALTLENEDAADAEAGNALAVTPEQMVELSTPQDQVQAFSAPNEPEMGLERSEGEQAGS